MSDLHPDWQATADEQGQAQASAPVQPSTPVRIPIGGHTVSRVPAALFGIALCAGIGFTAFGGWTLFSAQLNFDQNQATVTVEEPLRIQLTDRGIESGKETVTVYPGDTITWSIDSSQLKPHILLSNELRDQNGELLDLTIFPGEEHTFTISASMTPRAEGYPYSSQTNPAVKGFIIIKAVDNVAWDETRDPYADYSPDDNALGSLGGIPLPSGQGALDYALHENNPPAPEPTPPPALPSVEPEPPPVMLNDFPSDLFPSAGPSGTPQPAAADNPSALLPVNPYSPGAFILPDGNAIAANTLPQPSDQPETGPAVWVVTALSLATMLWVTRKAWAIVPFRARYSR